MIKDTSLNTSPQLAIDEQNGVVVALSQKQILSLYKKSEQSGIPFDTLKEVYERGYTSELTEQAAFNRVNSFIAGGAAATMDLDLVEKRGLWDNIWAKRKRIARGSGEHMRKPGSKGAPSDKDLKVSQTNEDAPCWSNYKQIGMKSKNGKQVPNCVPKEEYTGAEKVSKNPDDSSNRFIGTTALTNNYKNSTPGQSVLKTVKKVVKEQLEESADAKGFKSETGGLTQKGRDHYNRTTGSHLKAPVTKKPSELKPGSKAANRRKSFCARMGGMKKSRTSAKTAHDPDSRINKALRKWNC